MLDKDGETAYFYLLNTNEKTYSLEINTRVR